MSVPVAGDPVWKDIVQEKKKVTFKFMALNVFMGKCKLMMSQSPDNLDALAQELHDLCQKNASNPSVAEDLKQITG